MKTSSKATPLPRDRTWLGLILIALLFISSIWLVNRADATKPPDWTESHLTYLPSGKLIKPFLMDLDEAVADILWIHAMIYFAEAYLEQKSYAWLGHMLDVVSILNPNQYSTYEFAGVVLTKNKKELGQTVKILDRGIQAFPKDWKLRLYAATAQLGLDSNYLKAAEYLTPISLNSDVPAHIRTLSATLLSKGGERRMALAFLVDRYRKSDNPINREIFLDKILKLYPGPLDKEKIRKDAVTRVLREISLQPQIELMGLGIIHEYLSESLSPQSKTLMDMLYK